MELHLPLRPNVCMIVINSDHKILLGERYREPGVWQFPQGGVEPGSSAEESVYRELAEELGVRRELVRIECRLDAINEYNFDKPPAYAIGKWRGQQQSFWVVRFHGCDADIRLDLHTPEFQSFRWCSLAEVEALAEGKRMPAYRRALSEMHHRKLL